MTDEVTQQFSQDQVQAIKNALITNLVKLYRDFTAAITKYPCHEQMKIEAFRNFDTGFLWYKESIVQMPTPTMQAAAQGVPEPMQEQVDAA